MKRLNLLLLLLVAIQITACSRYYAISDDLNGRINGWLETNDFELIDSTLEHLKPDHPDYKTIKARTAEIKERKQAFINNSLQQAKTFVEQNKWQEAMDLLDLAMDKAPDSKDLETLHEKLDKQRNEQVIELRKNMLLARARSLIEYEAIYQKLDLLIPNDYAARNDIENYQNERETIASHLMNCNEHALTNNDFTLAETCLELSNKLVASTEKQQMLESIKRKRKLQENKQKVKQLMDSYEEAHQAGDLAKARSHLNSLLKIDPEYSKAQQLITVVENEIKQLINKGIQEGKELYSKGKINQALTLWNNLLLIDPENQELPALIARAQKISNKIEKLEKSSTR